MKKDNVEQIKNISLSAKQIKTKLEDALAYDHDKFRNIDILFNSKPNQTDKLPFSDYKISISDELYGQQLLLEGIKHHIENTKLIEEKIEPEIIEEETEEVEEEMHATAPSTLNDEYVKATIIEEVDEDEDDEDEDDDYAKLPYSERAKRPKGYTIKIVDVDAVIKKIKNEAIEKNKGKPVIGRRQINKLLKPYMIKKDTDMYVDGIENSLTSIDIYLNAVDRINTTEFATSKNSSNTLELNINEILEDLGKK